MNKQEFLARLRESLAGLPQGDVEEWLNFYGEMIDDRMEDGLSEAEAVASAGPVERIAAQVIADTPLAKIAKERLRPKRRLGAGVVLLLVLGAPLWLSLCMAAAAVVFSLYMSLWAVTVSLWAVFGSLAACALSGAAGCAVLAAGGQVMPGMALLAAGLVCAGLSILMFCGCAAVTKGILLLTRKMATGMKNCFIRKGAAA